MKFKFFFLIITAVMCCVSSVYPFSQKYLKQISSDPLEDIYKQWRSRAEIMSLGKDRLGIKELDNIQKIMSLHDINNVPQISVALLKEIYDKRTELSKEESLSLINYAIAFSPDIPSVKFQSAKLLFQKNSLSLKMGLDEIIKGFNLTIQNYEFRAITYANFFYRLFITFCITALLFVIVLLIKYLKLLNHLLTHAMPGVLSKFGIFLLLIGIPAIGFFTVGPLSLIFIFALYVWLFTNISEKLLIIVSLLTIMALPLLYYLPTSDMNYEDSPEKRILSVNLRPDPVQEIKYLDKLLEKNPDDLEAKFTQALLHKKLGKLTTATQILEELKKKKPTWDKVYVNLGNIEFIRGRFKIALSNYKKASALNESNFLAKYNAGKVHYREASIEEANTDLMKASGIDPKKFVRLESKFDPNNPLRHVFDEFIERKDLTARLKVARATDSILRDKLWENSGLIDATPFATFLIGIISIIFLIILSNFSRRLGLPSLCETCGIVFCKRCNPSTARRNICSQCYFIFIRNESIDPSFRAEKEAQEKRNKIKKGLLTTWISLVIPGFGLIYSGKSMSGVITMFLFSLLVVLALNPGNLLQDPYSASLNISTLLPAVFLILALGVYIISNLALRRIR